MNSEQYLSKLKKGSLSARLAFMLSELSGTCGQSSLGLAANAAKRANLKEAIQLLAELERPQITQ